MDPIREAEIKLEDGMNKTIEKLKQDLMTVRTGRANPSILDTVKVEAYGSMIPINQVASVGVPEPRIIEIRPWDANTIPVIEKAIHKAQLGISPNNDGKIIRIVLPPLTEETRKDLVKHVKKIEEQHKISIRNERRVGIEFLKQAEKDKNLAKDDLFLGEEDIQKITDKYTKTIEDMIKNKEKEIMEV